MEPWLFYVWMAGDHCRAHEQKEFLDLEKNVGGFANRVAEERLCIDTLLSEGVGKEKMCRKRFAGFDRYFQAPLHSSGKATQSGGHP